jgi:hypothetical protein
MLFEGKNSVVIYLEGWQMRMVKDFLGLDCHVWIVPIDGTPVLRYDGPVPHPSTIKRMYLTEWQKREIEHEMGSCPCDYVELTKEHPLHVLYGGPEASKVGGK